MPTMHLLIKGKVQGVFYRASARELAESTGLTGWIRNTMEGDVEAKVTGTDHQLAYFLAWCRKGPRDAEVTDVVATPMPEERFEGFRVRRS